MSDTLIKPGPSGAIFSDDRVCRYVLWRRWGDPGLPLEDIVAFIGLNPSTADEDTDDPTIRKCRGFAKLWGYDGMVMVNLFAFRATQPSDLKRSPEPYGGVFAFTVLDSVTRGAGRVVCCWGDHGAFRNVGEATRHHLRRRGIEIYHLGLTKRHQPKHPLYLPYDTPLIKWEANR